ncbi:hypothetical protein [Capnocytophaga sp. HP1101]
MNDERQGTNDEENLPLIHILSYASSLTTLREGECGDGKTVGATGVDRKMMKE